MKHLHRALGIGPLFYTGETPSSEEAGAELVQMARLLLDDPSFTLPAETTATPEELEDTQEALAVVLFKLREHSIRLETQQKQLEVEALLPYARAGASRRKQLEAFGDIHGKQRHLAALEEHKPWIKEARSLWAKNRHLSIRQVARRVVENLGLVADTRMPGF